MIYTKPSLEFFAVMTKDVITASGTLMAIDNGADISSQLWEDGRIS